ncbi:MAG: PD-(D/E)XK nuclease family protein [Treponema sp.]|jgi:hypothetical protein|nr:PD-(D/E)XK nuclease family protein [Treponema sp.]
MNQSPEKNAGQLLTYVTGIIKDFEERWQKTGEKYNIFKVSGIAHKEVIMCRVLADLMNPQGKHCQGSRYLRLFWETIAPKLPEKLPLDAEHTKVTVEYVLDENRRIDIALEDGKVFVPIEVKIWAGDQPRQVADYFAFVQTKNHGVHIPVLYLTVDGHEPSDFSKAGVGKNDYILLSFKQDILAWLEACARENATEMVIPVRENLKQLIAAIKSLCGKSEDVEMEDAIFKLVARDDDAVRAALAISGATDFDKRAWEAFKGPITALVGKACTDTEYLEEDGWYYLNVPIKGGRYWFEMNYLWDKTCVQAANAADAAGAEGKALYEKTSELFGVRPSSQKGFAWYSGDIAWPGFAKDNLYQFHLYKLYAGHPQEAADRIIAIVKALESVRA